VAALARSGDRAKLALSVAQSHLRKKAFFLMA
jgi:hypothetical protein